MGLPKSTCAGCAAVAIETEHGEVLQGVVGWITINMVNLDVPESLIAYTARVVILEQQDITNGGRNWGPAMGRHTARILRDLRTDAAQTIIPLCPDGPELRPAP